MFGFIGGAPEYDEKNIWRGWRPRIKITKALGYLQVCYGELQLMEYFNIAP